MWLCIWFGNKMLYLQNRLKITDFNESFGLLGIYDLAVELQNETKECKSDKIRAQHDLSQDYNTSYSWFPGFCFVFHLSIYR